MSEILTFIAGQRLSASYLDDRRAMLLKPVGEQRLLIFVRHEWSFPSDADSRSIDIGNANERLLTKKAVSKKVERGGWFRLLRFSGCHGLANCAVITESRDKQRICGRSGG